MTRQVSYAMTACMGACAQTLVPCLWRSGHGLSGSQQGAVPAGQLMHRIEPCCMAHCRPADATCATAGSGDYKWRCHARHRHIDDQGDTHTVTYTCRQDAAFICLHPTNPPSCSLPVQCPWPGAGVGAVDRLATSTPPAPLPALLPPPASQASPLT